MTEWCRIVEVQGNQVLFQNVYDSDDAQYKMQMTIQIEDWLGESFACAAILSLSNEKKPFRDKSFDRFAQADVAERIIMKEILPFIPQS